MVDVRSPYCFDKFLGSSFHHILDVKLTIRLRPLKAKLVPVILTPVCDVFWKDVSPFRSGMSYGEFFTAENEA